MLHEKVIKTTQTDPDHETIGFTFQNWEGLLYFCDSWESNLGFWMTRVDSPPERRGDLHSKYRRNVSERAIGRTFHKQHAIERRTGLVRPQAIS